MFGGDVDYAFYLAFMCFGAMGGWLCFREL